MLFKSYFHFVIFSAISNKLFYIIHPALNFSYYTFPLFYHLYHFLGSYSLFLRLSFYLTHETQVFYILTFHILICSVFGDDFIVFVVWVSFILPYVFFRFSFNLCSLELFVIYLKIFVCLSFSASHLETPPPRITLN